MLLEPDPSTPEYHVRKVTLDATTGAPTWDPSVSYGTFPLPMSAATLHSSGRVVVVNTDNGRIGSLLPANTPRPPQATYTAGPGTQTGLLSSPVAVAVTNPGVVLILEAAALQIAAFDLNGNPVQYFAGASAALTRRSLVTRARQRAGVSRLHPAAGLQGQLPRHGRRRLGPDLRALLHGRRDPPPPTTASTSTAPKGALINSVSTGVNAPHLSVDYWRSIYAANYDPLADTVSGQPRIDPDARRPRALAQPLRPGERQGRDAEAAPPRAHATGLMTDAEGDGESLLEELWTTPVGRRWVLEAGLASAVALGAAGHGARRAEPVRATRQRRRRRRETRHLHFALGHLRGVTELTLVRRRDAAAAQAPHQGLAGGARARGRHLAGGRSLAALSPRDRRRPVGGTGDGAHRVRQARPPRRGRRPPDARAAGDDARARQGGRARQPLVPGGGGTGQATGGASGSSARTSARRGTSCRARLGRRRLHHGDHDRDDAPERRHDRQDGGRRHEDAAGADAGGRRARPDHHRDAGSRPQLRLPRAGHRRGRQPRADHGRRHDDDVQDVPVLLRRRTSGRG